MAKKTRIERQSEQRTKKQEKKKKKRMNDLRNLTKIKL